MPLQSCPFTCPNPVCPSRLRSKLVYFKKPSRLKHCRADLENLLVIMFIICTSAYFCNVMRYWKMNFFLKIYLFIYFWLCWVFVSVRGLSLVAASGDHSSLRCAGLSLSWPLLLRSTGSRRAGRVMSLIKRSYFMQLHFMVLLPFPIAENTNSKLFVFCFWNIFPCSDASEH